MATLAKGSAFIFLMTFLAYSVKAQIGAGVGALAYSGGAQASASAHAGAGFGGGANAGAGAGVGGAGFGGAGVGGFGAGDGQPKKIPVMPFVPLSVKHPANVAVPIHYDAIDYNGPYDPADPHGIAAALHRQARIQQRKNSDLVKSYVPPGLGQMVKKEVIKTAVGEGRRFAVAHPKETAELVGIAAKAKALVNTTNKKIESVEKKEAKDEGRRGRD